MAIKQYETIRSSYGNHKSEIFYKYLGAGWILKQENSVGDYTFWTFERGEGATEVKIDYPNAHKI